MMILFMITWPKSPWAFNREGEKSRSHLATIKLESWRKDSLKGRGMLCPKDTCTVESLGGLSLFSQKTGTTMTYEGRDFDKWTYNNLLP